MNGWGVCERVGKGQGLKNACNELDRFFREGCMPIYTVI